MHAENRHLMPVSNQIDELRALSMRIEPAPLYL